MLKFFGFVYILKNHFFNVIAKFEISKTETNSREMFSERVIHIKVVETKQNQFCVTVPLRDPGDEFGISEKQFFIVLIMFYFFPLIYRSKKDNTEIT